MLYLQDSICPEISCLCCYWAHDLDTLVDHYNCLLSGETIQSPPYCNVCSCFSEDLSLELIDLSTIKRVAREN